MSSGLSPSAQRVQETLDKHGLSLRVLELPQSTRSAAEAAQAVGCEVAQIAKSLVFRGKATGQAVLVIASGANRVDVGKVAHYLCEGITRADADFVREATGFAIGGVPPVGHKTPLAVFIDADLMTHQEIWAAAGTPNAVFKLTPQALAALTKGQVIALAQAG